MSPPLLLSGKTVSGQVYSDLEPRIKLLKRQGINPGLVVILLGDDPASQVYVRAKARRFQRLGLFSKTDFLPADTPETELIELIDSYNQDPLYHGILVQMPVPPHINSDAVIQAISPSKDVDGFHPENVGRLASGNPRFIPCTPKGILRILKHYEISLSGKHVVVIGRSNIVGRPMSILASLKNDTGNATTTLCHSGTRDIRHFTRQADVVIAAIGRSNYITGDFIKDGAIIIDVGVNRVADDSEKGYHLTGDVDADSVREKVRALTPVPGGVGPMTIAMLVENTVESAEALI
ncbi:MAG: bifunctional 5,10-methylene-tetrahydrofolate dehydrogenase/5,10-methylene-tetrahydrofolate cyclohydrolase [FCB group bacterium]|nr:bifunctional 5,10-methylene-tetrahydrofolate dehydrogenase/5,10-methylene-tetrahydrofolate cyclohydrolase [FCB group bacterium]